ncbi:NAGAB acetylgalactosaminidase, partial [Podargus strigoides]|nr:NAGAB acetylgalactosaminidase [Podargus strigoides]
SEMLFFEMADRLAEDGWRELGYEYVNIDDCWSAKQRDTAGQLVPDPERFPSGIKALADYVHARGLKLGIYGDLGTFTCGGYPGTTLDYVKQDAQTFAEWGVGMLKLDGCYSSTEEQAEGYPEMARALNATGRPIVYSCSWPAYQGGLPPRVNYTILAEVCNLWHNYGDIQDSWDSVLSILDWYSANQDMLQPAAGPGHWNDPDMVWLGGGCTAAGWGWEVSKDPLLGAGQRKSTRSRSPVAAKRQSSCCPWLSCGKSLWLQWTLHCLSMPEKSHIEVFLRPLSQAASALVFFSRRTDMPFRYTTSLARLHFPEDTVYEVQDVYSGKIISGLKTGDSFSVIINPSGVVMWYLYPMVLLAQPWHAVRQQAPSEGFHPVLL